jgi:hypothetical protein
MDINSFNQCLTYMNTLTEKKGVLEILTPFITAIVSFSLGFFINMWRDYTKENKTIKNKKACISEDIYRAKSGTEQTFKECINIIDLCRKNSPIPGHSLPSEITTPGLDEYFWSIAHRYTEMERHHIMSLTPAIRKLNKNLEQLTSISRITASGDTATMAYNLISYTLHCHSLLLALQTGENQIITNIVSLADQFNLNSPYIEEIRTIEASKAVDPTLTP